MLISDKDERYQIVATTITTFFNNDSEVSLYLIEALKRPNRGDVETSKLLDFLVIICRFRFAFLERSSPYYWRNFRRSHMNAKDLLMELDYLRSEAAYANLEKEGVFEDYLNDEDLTEMMRIWHEVDGKLREICDAAIVAQLEIDVSSEISERIVEQLKRIYDEVKPYNALLGATVAQRLIEVFRKDDPRLQAKTG